VRVFIRFSSLLCSFVGFILIFLGGGVFLFYFIFVGFYFIEEGNTLPGLIIFCKLLGDYPEPLSRFIFPCPHTPKRGTEIRST